MRAKKPSQDYIDSLKPNHVFVFGFEPRWHAHVSFSCNRGKKFGAIWRQCVGLQGQSYAILTMKGGVGTIKPYVDELLEFAKNDPDKEFRVTRIGCGIAGFDDEEIASLFEPALYLGNVRLPESFIDIL